MCLLRFDAETGCVLQEFIRLGCLSKLSGKGLQQRMFFLVMSGYICLMKVLAYISLLFLQCAEKFLFFFTV